MNNNKLQTKDLITVGIFSAIIFTFYFAFGMLGAIPIFFILLPIIHPIVLGVPFMLYLTKVKKFGMITLMGSIIGLAMMLTGHSWISFVLGIILSFITDKIYQSGGYKDGKKATLAYGTFSLWTVSAFIPLWVEREAYLKRCADFLGENYANTIADMTPLWVLPIMFIASFIAGLIGAAIAKKVLKKHFKKAGII